MIEGKFVGHGIYIEDLDETYSWREIDKLSFNDFKQLSGFMNEKELIKVMNYKNTRSRNYVHIQNIFDRI